MQAHAIHIQARNGRSFSSSTFLLSMSDKAETGPRRAAYPLSNGLSRDASPVVGETLLDLCHKYANTGAQSTSYRNSRSQSPPVAYTPSAEAGVKETDKDKDSSHRAHHASIYASSEHAGGSLWSKSPDAYGDVETAWRHTSPSLGSATATAHARVQSSRDALVGRRSASPGAYGSEARAVMALGSGPAHSSRDGDHRGARHLVPEPTGIQQALHTQHPLTSHAAAHPDGRDNGGLNVGRRSASPNSLEINVGRRSASPNSHEAPRTSWTVSHTSPGRYGPPSLDWRVTKTPDPSSAAFQRLDTRPAIPDLSVGSKPAAGGDAHSKSSQTPSEAGTRNAGARSQSPEMTLGRGRGVQHAGCNTPSTTKPSHDDSSPTQTQGTEAQHSEPLPAYRAEAGMATYSAAEVAHQHGTPSKKPEASCRSRAVDVQQGPLNAMTTLALSARVHLNLGLCMPRGLAVVMIQVRALNATVHSSTLLAQ